MNITVIGSGYVGLVSGTCFAEVGNRVNCVDIDPIKIEKLNKGIIPIFEAGLELMVVQNIKNKRVREGLIQGKDTLELSLKLVTIDNNVDIKSSSFIAKLLEKSKFTSMSFKQDWHLSIKSALTEPSKRNKSLEIKEISISP